MKGPVSLSACGRRRYVVGAGSVLDVATEHRGLAHRRLSPMVPLRTLACTPANHLISLAGRSRSARCEPVRSGPARSVMLVAGCDLRLLGRRRQLPVLLITGPVGVGRATVGTRCSACLTRRACRARSSTRRRSATGWPPPADDPWNERLAHANLACAWENFERAGARRLVQCRVLEGRSPLRHVRAAVPGAEVVVVGLSAPLELIHARSDHARLSIRAGI
jgi:hypothetical protein